MSTHIFYNKGVLTGWIRLCDLYRFKGFTFVDDRHHGPILCRKDGAVHSRQPMSRSKFWAAFNRWGKLTPEKKAKTKVW